MVDSDGFKIKLLRPKDMSDGVETALDPLRGVSRENWGWF